MGWGVRDESYKLVDPFCMFYLKFVKGKISLDSSFWLENLTSQIIVSWRGFAFETVCFNHVNQIKKALGISGVKTVQSLWSKRADDADETANHGISSMTPTCLLRFYYFSWRRYAVRCRVLEKMSIFGLRRFTKICSLKCDKSRHFTALRTEKLIW